MEEIAFPKVLEQPIMWGYHKDLHQADKHKALVNPDTGKLFAIVSKHYRLIRHEQAIEQIEAAIAKNPDLGRYEVVTEFYNDAGRMRRRYVFPNISVEIEPGDSVNPELHLLNSYDLSWPFVVLLGAFRLVCSNGQVVGKKFLYLNKRHIYDLERIGLQEEVSTALERFTLQTDQWKEWTEQQLSPTAYDEVMKRMKFGKGALEEIENRMLQDAEGCDDDGYPIMTFWAFFNVLTWFITHNSVSLNHRVDLERRLRAATAMPN